MESGREWSSVAGPTNRPPGGSIHLERDLQQSDRAEIPLTNTEPQITVSASPLISDPIRNKFKTLKRQFVPN